LDSERRKSRELKTDKANYMSKRNELEELFLMCVEEVRRDIQRRKAVTLGKKNTLFG